MPTYRTPLRDRFEAKVDRTEGPTACHLWTAHKVTGGYGHIGSGGRYGRKLLAHRVAWEFSCGPIPDGYLCCHRCDNPSCVNPIHLFIGTQLHNVRDAIEKGRYVAPPVRPGERNSQSKLTEDQAREAIALRGVETQASIGARFGVSQTAISRIQLGKSWRHISDNGHQRMRGAR